MIAAAPVAGQGMMQSAFASGKNMAGVGSSGVIGYAEQAASLAPMSCWAKERLKNLLESRGQRVRDLMRQIDRLDPDLASSKSLSFSAKLRMQAERMERDEFDREHASLTQQIAHYAAKFTKG